MDLQGRGVVAGRVPSYPLYERDAPAWAAPSVEYARDVLGGEWAGVESVAEAVERRAEQPEFAGRTALEVPGAKASTSAPEAHTYAEFVRDFRTFAARLGLQGAPRSGGGEALPAAVLFLPKDYLAYVAMFGAMRAGGSFLNIDERYPHAYVKYVCEDVGAAVLVSTRALLPEGTDVGGVRVLYLEDVDLADAQDAPEPALGKPIVDDDVAFFIYTSGTTGKPKGVMHRHRTLLNYALMRADLFHMTSADRVANALSLSHVFALDEAFRTLVAGATLAVATNEVLHLGPDFPRWMQRNGITMMNAVSSLLRTMVGAERVALPRMRMLCLAGEAMTKEQLEYWSSSSCEVVHQYGASELNGGCCMGVLKPGDEINIGFPMPTFRVHVLDENLQPAEEGECCVGGQIARGYVNLPEKTAEAFVDHPEYGRIYKTGDIVRRLPNGRLQYRTRMDFQVNVRGYRVELQAIENVLKGADGIKAAACKVEKQGDSEVLMAFLELDDPAAQPDVRALRAHLEAEGMLPYMIPNMFRKIDKMPLTVSGKLQRTQLPTLEEIMAEQGESGFGDDMVSDEEKAVLEVFVELLGVPVGPDDDFFESGGHSGLAAALVTKLRGLGTAFANLAVSDVYAHPTARALTSLRAFDGVAELKFVVSAFEYVLKTPIKASDDFFAQGGHSVSAAALVGILRKRTTFASVAVSDLYANPTPETLAELASGEEEDDPADAKPTRYTDESQPWLCFVVQTFFIVMNRLGYGLMVVGYYKSILPNVKALEHYYQWLVLPLVAQVIVVVYTIFIFFVLMLFKWVLIGRYKPGVHPLWSSMFIRQWIVRHLCSLMPWSYVSGTPVMPLMMWMLGAKVGRNVHWEFATRIPITGFDLIEVGSGACINHDVYLAAVQYTPRGMEFGRIRIGEDATVKTRALICRGSTIKDGGVVGVLSCVTPGTVVGVDEVWEGSPAKLVGVQPMKRPYVRKRGVGKDIALAFAQYVPLWITEYISGALMCAIYWWLAVKVRLISIWLGTIVYLLYIPLILRIMGPTTGGVYERYSGDFVRIWLKRIWFEGLAAQQLHDMIFYRFWIIACGGQADLWAESSTLFTLPDTIHLGERSFVAAYNHIGVPILSRGTIECAYTRIGRKSFVGNFSVHPPGTIDPPEVLMGVMTVPPKDRKKLLQSPAGSGWFGNPAIFLPNRQRWHAPYNQTYDPSGLDIFKRTCYDIIRLLFPLTLWYLYGVCVYFFSTESRFNAQWAVATVFSAALSVVWALLGVAVGYLFIVGPLERSEHPYWHSFNFRWRNFYTIWVRVVEPGLVCYLGGTKWLVWWMNWFTKCRIGTNCYICDFNVFKEFDMVTIGDNVSIDENAILRTHTFEDRVLKIAPVTIKDNVTIGSGSTIIYDSVLSDECEIGPQSVVMKGETMESRKFYHGTPSRVVRRWRPTLDLENDDGAGAPVDEPDETVGLLSGATKAAAYDAV